MEIKSNFTFQIDIQNKFFSTAIWLSHGELWVILEGQPH